MSNCNTPFATMDASCAGHYCDCGRIRGAYHSSEAREMLTASPPPPVPRLSPPPLIRRYQRSYPLEDRDIEFTRPRSDSDTTYSSMPPLIPALPLNRILHFDEERMPSHIFFHEDDDEPEQPKASHLFFDDSGDEITREEFLAKDWGVKIPALPAQMVARHPRVLLAFFDFMKIYNDAAIGDETCMIPAIPSEVMDYIHKHPSFQYSDPFNYEMLRLDSHLSKHVNLSE